MGLGAVVLTGSASGLYRIGLGWPFGERGGLTLAGALLLLFEQAGKALDLGFQFGDAALQRLAARSSGVVREGKLAKNPADSCALEKITCLAGRRAKQILADLTRAEIHYGENPRKEAASNDLAVSNATLLRLGLRPITLNDGLLREITDIARVYAVRCDRSKIPATARWTQSGGSAAAFRKELCVPCSG